MENYYAIQLFGHDSLEETFLQDFLKFLKSEFLENLDEVSMYLAG